MPQPYKGVRVQHTIRMPSDLHRRVVATARSRRRTTNEFVVEAIEAYLGAAVHDLPEPVGVRYNQNVYADDGTATLT